uniref:Sushi domain-containing protein n=1 Tax=Cyanistes caeruleus TaxID=156563 RepID=A0A8C0TZ14_CYACU
IAPPAEPSFPALSLGGFLSISALPGQRVCPHSPCDRALVLPTGITCAPPPAIPHGTHSGGSRDSFSFGDVVTYTCSSGLAPAGDASLSCSSADGQRGSWSGAVPRCQGVFVGFLCPEIENGKATGLETTYKLKDIIFFECNFGYALKGSQESQCQFGGKWHPPVPTCEKRNPESCEGTTLSKLFFGHCFIPFFLRPHKLGAMLSVISFRQMSDYTEDALITWCLTVLIMHLFLFS